MNTRQLIALLAGLTVIVVSLTIVLFGTRKNRVEVTGEVLKVRTHSIEPTSTLAVMDFRVHNPSSLFFMVRDLTVTLEGKDGKKYEGQNVSEMDAQRMFQYFPVLGQKYNQTLLPREKIGSGQTVDRMIAVRFDAPEAEVQGRKSISISIREMDGKSSEISTGPKTQ